MYTLNFYVQSSYNYRFPTWICIHKTHVLSMKINIECLHVCIFIAHMSVYHVGHFENVIWVVNINVTTD